MAKRVVTIGRHLYYTEENGRRRQRTARLGEVIDVSAEEAERGERLNALATTGAVEKAADAKAAAVIDPSDLSDEKLAEFVSGSTVNEVVAAVQNAHEAGNTEVANRVLAVENAEGNQPRVGVLRGIEKVLSSSE